jgi:hypothetical protein
MWRNPSTWKVYALGGCAADKEQQNVFSGNIERAEAGIFDQRF